MDGEDIVTPLERAEQALNERHDLRGTGFWAAVAAVRSDAALASRYAERIAAIDRRAFEQAVRLRASLRSGVAILGLGTVVGLAIAGFAAGFDGTAQTVGLLLAWGVLTLSTHSLAHWLVGRALGIGFSHVFLGHFPDPFPGVKVDYATYLTTPPRRRVLMHASGALVSKIVPFALLAAGAAMEAPDLALSILLVIGIVSVVADIIGWYVAGDWKRVRRELRAARGWASHVRPSA